MKWMMLAVMLSCGGQKFNLPDGQTIYEGDYCPCKLAGFAKLVCPETGTVQAICQHDVDQYCRWLAPQTGGVL